MHPVHTFLMNSPWLGGTFFVLAAVLAALIFYAGTRALLRSHIAADSELLSARLIGRLGALHALILALIFAQEMADYRDISAIVSKEANAVGDVYQGLWDYDQLKSTSTAAIGALIFDYVNTVLVRDRKELADNRLTYQSWHNFYRIERHLRNLQPANDDQRDLRAQMLADWDSVSEFHLRIGTTAKYEVPGFLWMVMIAGFLAVVFPCYVYSPKTANLITISVLAAFNGIVMYVIFSIANPFSGPVALHTSILEDLLALMRSATP